MSKGRVLPWAWNYTSNPVSGDSNSAKRWRQFPNPLHFVTLVPVLLRIAPLKISCLLFTAPVRRSSVEPRIWYRGNTSEVFFWGSPILVGARWVPSCALFTIGLLQPPVLQVRTHQAIEYRQHVPPVFHHAGENIPQLRLAFRFVVPLQQHRLRHFNIPAQLFRRMSAQK